MAVRAFHREAYPNDQLASLLEELVRPQLVPIQRELFRTYVLTLDAWVASESEIDGGHDTQRLERLIDCAWSAAVAAIAPWDPRFAVPAIRSIPTRVIDDTCGIFGLGPQLPNDVTRVATAAAAAPRAIEWPWWRKAESRWIPPGRPMRTQIAEHSPAVIGGCIGASLLMVKAERLYRATGKRRRIARMPDRLTPEQLDTISQWQGGAILILPDIELAPDPPIEHAIALYDQRRQIAFQRDAFRDAMRRSPQRMWYATRRSNPLAGKRLALPALDLTFIPTWDIHADESVEHWIEILRPFDDEIRARMGISCDRMLESLRALAVLLERRTHCAEIVEQSTQLFLRAEVGIDDGRALASLVVRGMLRFTLDELQREVGADFVRAFTGSPEDRGLPAPVLFYDIDPSARWLDLARWHDFKDAFQNKATAGDDDVGNRRGSQFEDYVRARLIAALALSDADSPWPHGRNVLNGSRNFGDVDLCFLRDGVLFHLDMKSWQRKSELHIGHFHTIRDRQKELDEAMAKVEDRGDELQRQLTAKGAGIRKRLDFLITPVPEYLAPDRPRFWYGAQPRVLIVDELIAHAGRD